MAGGTQQQPTLLSTNRPEGIIMLSYIRNMDPVKRRLLIATLGGLNISCGVAYIITDRAEKRIKKTNDAFLRRYKFYVEAFSQIERTAKDITISGNEREKRIAEILRFLEIVVNEEPT